ncbi:MAG: ABC transporter permease [Lacunisphaera sp.]|jgi:ribose transport system permease protein|nr:ABC transporter permease [Lacunisphaera sp.]
MQRFRAYTEFLFLALLLVALAGLFGLLSDHFWTLATLQSITSRIPALALTALGMTFVLVAAGIDLSVGSVTAVAGAVFGWCVADCNLPLGLALGAAVAAASGCGLLNGALVNALRMPSFIVTLGVLEAARGGAYLVTGSQTKYLGAKLDWLQNSVPGLGLSAAFLLAVGVALAAQFVLTRTVLGRQIVAVGTNAEAARLVGISPARIRAVVFAVSGGLAGLAGLCQVARLGAADPNAGAGMELSAIAAAVIGGTSLMGGRGSMLATFIGVLIIATLEAGLAHLGVSEPMKRVTTGAVIVGAVGAEAIRARLSGRQA